MISQNAAVPLIKGLMLQFAVRHDWQRISYAGDTEQLHPKFAGTMYTAGSKFYPLPWLMLRASYATGQQPPPTQSLGELDVTSYTDELIDPKRGGAKPDSYDQYDEKTGNLSGRNVKASTLAVGIVLNPNGAHGPRISVDYSHTRETNVDADPDLDLILAREDTWPQRVTRAPLTDEDREIGYTGGVITMIDARGLSYAQINVKSLDARLDWPMPFAGGILRAYGSVTRQFKNRETGAVVQETELVGFVNGPLKLRANGGAEWSRGHTTVGANLQYFSRYRIVDTGSLAVATDYEAPQGSNYVKAQAYLDLSLSRRFSTTWAGAAHEMSLDLGVINLLDHRPAYQAQNSEDPYGGGTQASLYGDPRQRRIELTLNTSF